MKRQILIASILLLAAATGSRADIGYTNTPVQDIWDYEFSFNPGGDNFMRSFGAGTTNDRTSTGNIKFDLAGAFSAEDVYLLRSAKLTIWQQASATPPNPNDAAQTLPIFARTVSPYLAGGTTSWTEANFTYAQRPDVETNDWLARGASTNFATNAAFSIDFDLDVGAIDFAEMVARGEFPVALQSGSGSPIYRYYTKEGSLFSFTNLSRAPQLELHAEVVPSITLSNTALYDVWDYPNSIDPGGDIYLRIFGDGTTNSRESTADLKFDLSGSFTSGRVYRLARAAVTVWHQANNNPPNPDNPGTTQPIHARWLSPLLSNGVAWTEANFTIAQRPAIDMATNWATGSSPDFGTNGFRIVFDLDLDQAAFDAAVNQGALSIGLQSDQNPGFPPTNPLYRCYSKEGSAGFFGNASRAPALEITAYEVPEPDVQVELTGAGLCVTVSNLLPSSTYSIQRGDDLLVGPWTNIATFTANGAQTDFDDALTNQVGQGFYRVVSP